MSKPPFEDIFRGGGRRNRLSFFYYSISVIIIASVLRYIGDLWMDYVLSEKYASVPGHYLFLVLFFVICITVGISNILVTAQRCRDCNWSSWLVFILFVPLFNILFLLVD